MIKLSSIKKKLFNVKLRILLGGSKKNNISIAPTLSQYGINLRDFILFFEDNSFYIKNGFEVSCAFCVDNGKIENFMIFDPSSSFFLNNFKLFKNINSLNREDILKLIYEVSRIKSNRSFMKHLNLKGICKTQLSVLKSYNSGDCTNLKEFFYV